MQSGEEKAALTLVDDDSPATVAARVGLSRKALVIFSIIALFVLADVLHDASLGAEVEHLLVEGVLMVLAIWGALLFRKRWLLERQASQDALARAAGEARRWQVEAEVWRREARAALDGLAQAIDTQFERWDLSPAEREVGLLLLKGLSMKEVADIRETSERTTRQQARAVYKKSGLAGRAELAAFFLEDLMLPVAER